MDGVTVEIFHLSGRRRDEALDEPPGFPADPHRTMVAQHLDRQRVEELVGEDDHVLCRDVACNVSNDHSFPRHDVLFQRCRQLLPQRG